MDVVSYALSKKYTEDTADSLGSLKGAPATIKSITPIDGGNRITFSWTGTSGTEQTQTLDVMDGAQGIQGETGPEGPQGPQGEKGDTGEKGADGTMSFDDLTPEQKASLKGDPGEKGDTGEKGEDGAKGDPGEDGYSPTVTVTEITGGHRVTITDEQGDHAFDVMDGEGGQAESVDWSKITNKPENLATTDDVDAKVFVAIYGETSAQDIIAFIDGSHDPVAPIVIKMGNDYYTCITAQKQADNKVIIRSFATLSGNYYIFTYTVTDKTWGNANTGFQPLLQSGTNIKTVNGESLLGSGDITISGGASDWSEIQNKPDDLVQDADYQHTDNNFTTAEKTKLADLADIKSVGTGLSLSAEGEIAVSGSGESVDWSDIENKPTGLVEDSAYVHTDNNYSAADKAIVDGVTAALADKANTADLSTVATSGSYNDLDNKPTIPSAYDDTAITGRVSAVETALDGHTVGKNVPSDAVFTDTVYDDTALANRVTANETAIADRYTKAETDSKIAEAITDPDVEHFHVVTALPAVADAEENHEYVLVTYEQDGTTIASETHYLFYDGAYHQRTTTVSLDGYATEQYVDDEIAEHVKTDVPVDAVFTDTVYDDTALSGRVAANETAISDLLDRTYDTKGAYNSLIQDCDEFIYPDSAAAMYRVFMQSLATKGSRNVIDYCYEISFNDGADSVLVWLNVSEYKFDFGTSVTSRETYEAKDRDGNLVCYFFEVYRNATNGAWGIYFVAPDKNYSSGGSSEILGNRIAKIEAYEPITIYNVSKYVDEDFNLSNTATLTDVDSGVAEAKAYADSKALVTQTGWGIVKCGEVLVSGITSTSAGSVTLDLSEWGFASVNDYDIFVTVIQNYSAISARAWVEKQSAASARIIAITGQGDAVGVYYVIVAKGYGAVAYTGEIPTGGTAGQILTKRSDTDGDYGWQNKLPSYEQADATTVGTVVQKGTFKAGDTTYGIYEFYYRTGNLPNTGTTVYDLSVPLADYTINNFIDATGITSNSLFIGSGRTDGTNYAIVQQFSKNNKTVTIRTYQDFSAQTALLKIQFIGTKNS